MLGYIKKTKSSDNHYVYPVTVSDAVYISATETLTQKLTEIDYSLSNLPSGSGVASKWTDKEWCAIGDSITEHNGTTTKNYHDYITDIIGCTVYNYGLSGSGFYSRSGVASTITQTPDLLTFFFGTNDWANVGTNNKALGAFGDTGTTTISGCINTMISGLITSFPTKIIAAFTPLPRNTNYGSSAAANTQGYTLEQLANMIITHCKHYGIPCLDLYHNSNFYIPNATAMAYYIPDGLHPNDNGHQLLATKILSFLNTL